MLSALGTLASFALPKLMTFASKKLGHSTIGKAASTISNTLQNPGFQKFATDLVGGLQDEDNPEISRALEIRRLPQGAEEIY